MSLCYLLDATAKGRIVVLKFYDAETGGIREVQSSDYKPYFFIPNPFSKADEEGMRSLCGEPRIVKKLCLFTGEIKDYTKVTVSTLGAFQKAGEIFDNLWESEVDYAQSYVYDHNLVFGSPCTFAGNMPILVSSVSEDVEKEFENVFGDIKDSDPQKYVQIKHWFSLLQQPIPQIKPEQLGMKTLDADSLHRAFVLSRIANLSVTRTYESHRVSDWLKSMIYDHLRNNNTLIPTSTELRRGLETHRVEGALTIQPKPGTYFNTVVCDFESLYPSVIDSYNLSHETVDCPHEECQTNRISESSGHWVCRNRRGFWAVLVGAIKDLRIRWFKPLAKNSAATEQERKTAQTIAKLLKLISVSSYGVTVRIHGLACPPLAECITGYGRWALQTTWSLAESEGMHPVYGDTDSVFLDNPQESQVKWLMDTVKDKLRLDLAIEKRYALCVLPAAKKAYYGIFADGTSDLIGPTAIKSNSPKWIQTTLQNCISQLAEVKNREYEEAKKRIVAVVHQAEEDLKGGKIPLKDLVYAVRLYSDPKERKIANPEVIPQAYQCALQLMEHGEEVTRNELVSYVKVKSFYFKGRIFTVKPVKYVGGTSEINLNDYVRNMRTSLRQVFGPMGIKLERPEKKLTDWLENPTDQNSISWEAEGVQ